jgi:hypothetical protein
MNIGTCWLQEDGIGGAILELYHLLWANGTLHSHGLGAKCPNREGLARGETTSPQSRQAPVQGTERIAADEPCQLSFGIEFSKSRRDSQSLDSYVDCSGSQCHAPPSSNCASSRERKSSKRGLPVAVILQLAEAKKLGCKPCQGRATRACPTSIQVQPCGSSLVWGIADQI